MNTDSNLVDVLRRRACEHPDRVAYRFLDDGEEEGGSLTYAELDRRARALGAFLQRHGGAGERALLLYPPGLDFVVSFLGCLYAGTVAVPAYPPRSNRPDSRLQAIARDARPRFALTTPALRDKAGVFLARNPELAGVQWVATGELYPDDPGVADAWERGPELNAEGVAFLQYTSGSTATPKGVVVRHGNLVHNEEMIRRAFGQSEESVIVGWLPLYHDMGLIGNVLQPLYVGGTCVLMAPVAFLQRPSRWLRAISRYRATGSGGPNFAYELCVRKIGPAEREGLDLSCWEVAYNGAEPVRAETLERFAESFAPQGFRRDAFYPCYGLAEATLFVSGAERGSFPEVLQVDAEALERNRAEEARSGGRSLVSCGSPWLDQRIEIVDPETCRPLPKGEVGEVWISGPSVAGGYWNRPEESARTFGARIDGREETFLRTGDLGFLADGALYLTGRAKDLIILRGRNLYPQDLELTAERSHGDLRPGCGAAFAVEVEGEERLVLVQEVERDAEKRWQRGTGSAAEVAEAVRRAVATEHEAAVHAVVLLRAGSVPKTSSGKIRRQSCRADFLAGNLEPVEQWTQGDTTAGEAPRTPTEERLERIWAEVLGLERVGVERDLFELGADSLRATQLLARTNEAFGVGLTIDSLFGAPSIAELATLVDQGDVAAAGLPLVPVEGAEAPLSFAQRRLWFLHQLDPENPVHNIAASIRLRGRLDVAALAQVFDEVVRRHEALRTGFASPGEEPVQVVRPAAPLQMPVIDHASGGEGRLAADLARLPFSLETGPFLRVALVRFSEDAYELLLSLHHIASDGGSLAVLVREMGALYEAFAAGRPSPLPDLPVQYADYAAWQRRRLDAGGLQAGLAFWRQQLGGELPVVELPADHPRPAVLSYRGAHCERLVPARLVERLEALARDGRATRFMALLAGFTGLLHRYTGLDDLVVGTPIDGRNRVELEGLIGVFLNNLVLRTRLDGRPGFRELLARVRRTALDAYAHQEVPFERLVDELRPERDLSRTPLFQVMFVGQNAPLKQLDLSGLALQPREVDLGTARFDLSLSMGEADGGWLGIWKYSTDLFEAATMERMAGHLESLLAAAVAEPERPVALLPMLSEAERRQVVEVWNDTAATFPDEATLHGLFEEQVRRTPDAIALEYGEHQLTYDELNRRANRLARHLRGLGIEADALVGIAAERSIEMVVGLMGILKAGGAYVPMDPSYPQERIAYMLEDSGVGVVLTQSHLELPVSKAALVRLDEPLDGPDHDFVSGALPESLAYCIYTSGSTGRPKGAGIPHRGIVNRLHWMQSAYRLTAEDRVLQKTPFSFDVSVWEFFWPLLTGARLVMAPPGAHQDAARLAELIRCHGITTLHFVPSMLQIFLDQDGLADSCRSVRRVFASGEALPLPLKERFFGRVPSGGKTELHNLYGPTEASVDVTFHACRPGGRAVPIGRPIDNTSILILDKESQPVPVGVPGELHIGGVNLARGYLGRPELTAERFVPSPFGDGERLYRTGDLAKLLPDGEVEYLGRLDFQVKIRGVRIELGEIEAELSRHPGVREVCVLARDSRLVAYLTGEDAPQSDELRSYLRGRLPEAMVPSAFVVLPAFPLNPSGKVDRKALPAPEADRPAMTHGYEEPRTELERRLADMWRDLLGIERVGIHDSFFELGGDSIQGAMFINRLQKELGRIVYVMSLFDAPTVATFAEYLATAYPDAVGRLGGEAAEQEGVRERLEVEPALEKLRAAVASRLGRRLGRMEPTEVETGRPIPRAAFLLSPFRSGSTLLRVMLAGHPRLFAPPELELLAFRTMAERRDVYSGRNRFAVEGLLRAVMDLHGCDADRAREIVAEAEDQGLTVGRFFRRLQEWAGGRLVVDKTPSYALDLWTLRRAERMFDEPLYVHLVRHPRATIDSYLEAKMDQVYGFPFPPEEQAELVWTLAHRNILTFLEEVPAERRHRLHFEELVKDPRGSMEALSRFLGLEMDEGMLQPYQGQRMTDGLHAGTRMMGDPKFHEHRGIDASVADRWQTAGGSLAPESWRLATELGYPAPKQAEDLALHPMPRTGEPLPLSFSQERLWFLTQLDPDSPAYNMPAAVLLEGALDVPALARSFGEVRRRHEVLRTVYPAVSGEPSQRVTVPTYDLPVMDLSGLPAELRETERRRLALEEGRRPFDLTVGPMLRTSLLKLGAQEHVLLLTMHHIASDGWTIGILIRELEALYRGAKLPELPLQYADYAAWQRRWLDSSAMEQHLAYWRTRLSGRLPVLEMPTDRPRPAVLTSRGARLSRTIPVEDVRAWSQKEGGTLFLTLLAAFNALLHRYTGHEDLLLGIPIANRNRLETENLIGFFLNMVVQRTDVGGDPAFRELLARVSDGFLGSTPHQEVPFEKLVEDLQPERDLSRTPIFQVQFSLQNTPTQALDLPGVTLKLLENHNRTTKFDFTVFLFDLPEGLTTTLEYNVDLYDESTIDRLLRHWETLLTGSVAAPELRLADLPMLAAEERAQLLTGWADFPAEPSIHRLFEEQAAKHPKDTAAVYEVSELSYRKLNERANQLAWRLRAMGVGPETPVGLCVERSLDTIVGILGILKAGGAYVPLDPAYPAERLSWILENALSMAAAPVLVTQSHLVERFDAPYPAVLLDKDRASLAGESTENLSDLLGMGPDNAAYVIYTSGSTGRPKGVPVTHANAVRLFTATDSWFGFGPEDVWTVFHSYAFDFSVWEIWGALLYGGRLVMVPREVSMNPAAFYELLVTEGVTVLSQTPSAFRQLIKADEEEGRGKLALKWVVFGGEALDLAALAPWIERHGDEKPRLINMYGITETTVHVTFRPVTKADLDRPGASPVGEPIPDLQVHLLGTHGELLPVGVPGEIHVGGAGLARGYLTRPELTAERFIPNPFSPDPFSPRPGARLYRSGDLARRRPDGDLDYLGRIDGQVKIRGFRIELGEIESALNRHPGLRESVVMAQTGPTGDRRLVAWIVPKAGEVPTSDLREHLLQTLPEYMVPAAFVSLEKLPLTTHGKVDRRALPEPGSVLAPAAELVAPRSRTEARLAEIWREVLHVEQVGVHDNFFELGGHSLLVSQLSSRVRNAFGVELPLRQVFEAPTLEALAARVDGVLPEKQERIERVPRTEPLPLSFAQERLWFLDQLEPGSPLYNVPVSLRLKGRLDFDALAATFREIVRRHEALRTSFGEADGRPVQVIEEDGILEIPFLDISHLPEREAALARLAEEEARRPFDLRRAPLLRVQAVKLAEDEHAVLATLHHIVSDGWSLGVLVQEVAALYSGKSLPELPVQYADFAVWQRARLTGDWLEAEVGHWRSALAGASTVLDLPTDHPRPARQSFRGRHLPVELPAALVDRMKALAKEDGSTLFMALLAGFQALLHRYTGQEDFLVGSPVANRTREEVEPLIGFFVNTLALRARLEGDPAFRELVGRVKGVTLDAYAHQDLPFERLVEALEPERDLSRSPLFQVLFVLQNAPFEPLALPDLILEPLELESGTSKFDLSLYFMERPDGRLGGFLEIDTALFEEATAHRLLEHFRTLLESAAADPAGRVSELAILSRAERRQVLKGWNETAAELPETTVASLFEEQARRTPEAVAVSQGEARLTYAELDERAEGVAAHLRSQGIGPESRVGISMERTPDMLVAILGVLKAGAAYVPLDPSHPQERLNLILEAARPETVISDLGRLGAPSPAQRGRVGEGAPDGLAYILFTSGSTGRPKGVQIPQRALVNFLLSMAREPGLTADDVLLAVTTLSFDIAGLELLLPLIVGARVEIATREEASDAELLKKRLAGATVMQATPATWRMLLDSGGEGWEGGAIKALCGGEALPSDLAAKLLPRVGSLWNMYGPTETTIWSAARRVAQEEEGTSIAVGGAIANTRLYVLDRRLEPVPVGAPGELCIGGEGLARGYLDAPDLTAERFVPDPFAEGRMYRTGDLVRWRPDGAIEFLGRIDFQVKVRGFRIELGEIEAALVSHPAVRQAVAGLRGDRLVAWAVTSEEADLREHLKGKLPEYMIPSAFVSLDTFPLTPSGKVDRKALPEPERATERGYIAPRGPVEELIAGIWSELLGIDRVGSEDSFFELGGHSLLATQLVSRLRRVFGVELPVRQLFETPTLARLAERVQAAGRSALPPLVPVPREGDLPLSFSQERLWFLDQLQPGSPLYNIPVALRLRGPLQAEALAATFREIVRRHEALRTSFAEVDGRPVQRIWPEAGLEISAADLSHLPEEEREAALARLAEEEARRPFDLRRAPLLRVQSVRMAEDDHAVLVTVHHIVSDGWSMGVLVDEIAALYSGSALPALPVQYADYAVWQRGWLAGELLDAELAHWRDALAGAATVLEMPADHPRPAVQGFRGRHLPVALPAALVADLKALALREGSTLFMALLAGFETLLHRYTGQDDFLVGSPVANRSREEVERLIGFFVNTLALRARVEGEPSFRELVGRVRGVTLDAYAHQDLPFERLVEALQPERDLSRSPLFQVLFVLQNAPFGALELSGLSLAPMAVESGVSRFDLTLTLTEGAEGLSGALEYDADLFEEATAQRLMGHFRNLLEAAVAGPETSVPALAMLGEAERRQVLKGWNDTAVELPEATVTSLFEEQARRTPEAVAVSQGETRLTYAELDERAESLAAHLRSQGIGPESRVGIQMERTPDMVVAILGVLKAGAAYVPLDPSHPQERLNLILEAAKPETVLSQSVGAGLAPAREGVNPSPTSRNGGSLAYILFTSGSTGRPKGVQIPQRALVNFLLSMAREPGLSADDVLLAVTTLSFDIAGLELLLPLIVGARVEIATREDASDAELLKKRLAGATVMQATPATWRMLLDAGWEGGDLKALCGGEALPSDLAAKLLPRVGSLWNMYGPTETTIWSAARRVAQEEEGTSIAVGGSIANTRLYVLDRRLEPVPVGVPGELCIGGEGLARGYLDAPDLTAERFVPDPFAEGRMYRTGDLVRWRPDGSIEFLGRIDFQVKVRGFRIELGEIEAALVSHPAVHQAVAGLRGDRLVAWVVADAEADLREHLKGRLPEYMIPSAFVTLDAFPLTPSGKVDRKALPEPSLGERRFVAPHGEVEEMVAGIWSDLLGAGQIGRDDSFFELGGHSLLATRLVSRLRRAFNVELPVRQLFETPTVAGLAARIQAARNEDLGLQAPPIVAIPAERREGELQASFAQERLWFLDRFGTDRASYNIPVAVRLSGRLDVPALAACLAEIVRRHESLRTSFALTDGATGGSRVLQVIAPPAEVPLPVVDIAALPDPLTEAVRLGREEARRVFDLGTGPLLRATLARLGEREHTLLVSLHHIVADGWSIGILVRELSALYPAFVQGRPSPLPDLPVQYADFAAWQRDWLRGEVLEAQLGWWRERLAGAPAVIELPADRPRPAVQSARGGLLAYALPAALTRDLEALVRGEGATLFMALLAGFQALLARTTGREDLPVGTPIAGRNRIEVEDLIGLFVNTLVMRGDLSGDPGFRELLGRSREAALGAYAHQDVPFEKLVEELRPERDLSHAPLFQTMVMLQNAPMEALELPELTVLPVVTDSGTTKFDLRLALTQTPEGLAGNLVYNRDLFDASTVVRLGGYLETLLTAAVAHPELPLSELPLLGATERRQLLQWGDARPTSDGRALLHRLFEAQASERIAVTCNGENLTYRELDMRANRLAHALIAEGVRPGDLVGLRLERSLDMVVAVLGVLKAGGAYLPLDPTYPEERLAFAIEDSRVAVVITPEWLGRAEHHSPENPGVEVTPDFPAYVIYTSGSTGRPKGVVVTHANATRLFAATDAWFGFGPEDVWTLFHSYAFDFSVWELWGALLYGGRLVVVPYWVSRSPEAFYELVRDEGVTVLNQTPSAFRQLIWAEESILTSLRYVIFGGEALELASLAPWYERHADDQPRLVNMYGITETTVHVTYRPLSRKDVEEARGSVIGVPIPDLSLRVLDRDLRLQPIGVPGEIHVGGEGLAMGYLGRPELTAERFVPDPFGPAGARLYRSGDLARYLADGDVEYLGRIDHQVKIRGFRIELGEIETALTTQPEIREAVVLAREDKPGDKRLVAYLVGELPDDLRERLKAKLPEYMMPAAFVTLPALPLTANGKVDRKALPVPEAAPVRKGERTAPRTALERFLAELWQSSLSIEIGIEDDFFEMGGNSLTGAILINRLQETLGEIVQVVVIFDAPSVQQMAAYLIANHSSAVERVWGEESLRGAAVGRRQAERVDAARVEQMRGLVRPLPPIPPLARSGPKNPPAVFVLAPPRSGTTLMRVLLGGHPRLFAPPELELLSYNTLAERKATYTGRDAFWLEGLVRAVMEIRGCTAEEATETIAVWEDEGWTAKRAYGQLQEWLGERILVDKTPSYALDPEILQRAEEDFEEPLYVHLVRHPNGMIRSFEEAKLDQLFFRREHPFERRELAELIWQVSQENILRFLETVPEKRKHLVRFEELVRDPEPVLRRLCDFLGLDFDPAMLRPYEDRSRRMTDGVHAESRMLGDVKFHTHSGIDAGTAESWRRELSEESLGQPTRAMAERLGYSMPAIPVAAGSWTAIPRVQVEPGTPQAVSFAQERFWFLNRMDDTQAGSIILAAVRLVGELRQDALSAALDEVARRHGSLRTRFAEQGGKPVQIVLPAGPVPLPRIDLTALPAAEAEAETRRLAGRELLRPFDLAEGRLLRVLLLPLPGGDHALLVFLHHIVADGWSIGVFLREMGALYQGAGSHLPALPVQYTDFARWQRETLRGERLETEVGYWRQRLAGLPALDLPVDRQAVSEKDFLADAVTVALPGELAGRLRALAQERGATMFMTLLAAFHALLARHTGQDDVAVGSPIAGRNRAETERLIGLFVNTLVLRGDLSGAPTFADLLERERQSTLGAFAHQDLPFALLVEALRPERRRGRYPFAEVLFSLQNQPIPKLEMPGLTLARLWSSDDEGDGEVRTAFPLSLMLWESGGTVQGGLGFNSALFDRATAERWRDNLMTLLSAMAERPGQPISEVPLLSVGERRQVVAQAPAAEPAVSEGVAKQRAELSSRRGQLSAAKRELLEKRLRGQAKGAAAGSARQAAPAEARILVPLQAGNAKGSRPPLFCVHAIGGSVFSYGELARALGPEQAFYGLQSPGLEGGPLYDDVPAMAAEYAAALEAAAPGGPVLVGGWSFGGVVAFEMARQLRARGREIPLLVLLDSYAPSGADLLAERSDAELLRPILLDQGALQGRGAEWLDEMPMAGEEAVIRMLEQARAAGVLRAEVQAGKAERLLGVYKANLRALSSYRPQPYGGRVLLFRSEGAEARRPANGWEGLAGEPIEVQSVSGDHYGMLAPPHVVHLARSLGASIERALQAGTQAEALA